MRSLIVGCVFAALWTLSAAAQSVQPDRQNSPSITDPKACAQGEQLKPGERGPEPPATTGRGESTSDKLARTDGVICPPNLDSQMEAPAPGGGKTPVIPPPGAPGGDPTQRPK